MGIDSKSSVHLPFVHGLADSSNEPKDSEDMVRMGVGHKNIVDTGEVDIFFLQYLEDAVSSPCIH